MDDVDIGLEEGFDGSLTWIDPYRDRSENTSDQYSVSGLGQVDQFVVDTQRNGMRRLSIWYSVGCLLQSDDLFVEEGGSIVNERHCAFGTTDVSGTFVWLGDLSSVNVDLDRVLADETSEEA